MDVTVGPADLFIFVKGAGCRWRGAAWWCAATPPRARAAAPPAATTTSPCNCRPPYGPHNSSPHPNPAPKGWKLHENLARKFNSGDCKTASRDTLVQFPSPLLYKPRRPRPALSISIAPLAHSGKAASAGSQCPPAPRPGGDILVNIG